MKCLTLIWVLGCCLLAPLSRAGETPAAEGKTIALVAVGEVDAGMLEAVRQFAEENAFFKVNLLPALSPVGGALDQEGAEAAKALQPEHLFMVALVVPKDGATSHGVYLPENRVAVVNVAAMKPAEDNPELFKRRLQRQTVRSIGMLLGLEACPNPQCCMTSYKSVEEMDMIGMNFCPPCWDREEKLGQAKGLQPIEFKDAE